MLVVIQAVLSVGGDVEVFPSVVVVIAYADALAPAGGGQASLHSHIGEGSIVVVAVEMVGGGPSVGKAFESGSIDEEDVRPSIVVVIEDGDAGPGGFDNVFFRGQAAENVGEGQSCLFGHVNEIDRGVGGPCRVRLLRTSCDVGEQDEDPENVQEDSA